MSYKKNTPRAKPIAVKTSVHKDISQFCLDYGYKQYQVVAEGFKLLKEKKEKEKEKEKWIHN